MSNNIVQKPWGSYEDIYRHPNVVFKKLIIKPNEEISLQKHLKRDEVWFVAEGEGTVVIRQEETHFYKQHDAKYLISADDTRSDNWWRVEKKQVHKIINHGEVDLVIYEMQFGKCDENDIIRLEDKYGRK